MEKLKFAIVGTGSRGVYCFGEILKNRPDVEIVALCDVNEIRMKTSAEFLGGTYRLYTSLTDMLKKEKLDAVIITTPDFFHEANAVEALEGKCNVLIDKPLATTVKGCRNIIAAAEKTGKTVMLGFNLRHHEVLKRMKAIIERGDIGRIFMMENREFYNGGRTYMSRWNRFYSQCGGLWIHKGSHDFDVFQWLMNFPKPVKVSAFADISVLNDKNLPFELKPGVPAGPCCRACAYAKVCKDCFVHEDLEHGQWRTEAAEKDGYYRDTCMYLSEKDNHDNGIAIVEYDNGVRASHLECFITSVDDRRYTIVGTLGQMEASLTDRTIKVCPRWSKEVVTYQIPEGEGGHGGADPGLVETFVRVIKGEITNTSTTEHGMWSTAVGQAAEISRREGRTVEVQELFKK